jgi:1-acyl-sn-glycerol-3-phosphate acyltransferase
MRNIAYSFFKVVLTPIFKLYYHPRIIGRENLKIDGSMIVCGNHKHLYDQCLAIMSTKRYLRYMAKKEYFDSKMAWFFKIAGCIPVDRSRKDNNAVESALAVLNNGGAIGIFPEGTRNRSHDKLLLDFKFGAVSMASKSNSYLVPFVVTGDYKFRSRNLVCRFGKPFKVGEMDLESANKKLHDDMEKMIYENLKLTGRSVEEELESHMKK